MTALRTTLCLLSLVGISGFSSAPATACAHVASSYATLNQKVETCGMRDSAIPFDASACQTNTGACSGADRATIEQFLSCVDRLPTCGVGDESAFRTQFDACAAGAQLSPGCSL